LFTIGSGESLGKVGEEIDEQKENREREMGERSGEEGQEMNPGRE